MSQGSLYQKLTEAIGVKDSQYLPGIFQALCSQEEARLLLAASPPKKAEELAEELGMPVMEVQNYLDGLFKKGLAFKSKKPSGIQYYRVRSLSQLHDATVVWTNAPREFLDLWKRYSESELPDHLVAVKKVLPRPGTRVIPIGRKIDARSQILAYEDVRYIVDGARLLAVVPCSCRKIDGKCGKPIEVCIQVDKAAEYSIERGSGRAVSKEEAMGILKMAEREGLVHVSDNKSSDFRIICNCCSDCCLYFSSEKARRLPVVAPSRFRAEVDSGLCSGCTACVEACPFGAIHAAQGEQVKVSEALCMGCGVCSAACPEEAIMMREIRSPDFIPGIE